MRVRPSPRESERPGAWAQCKEDLDSTQTHSKLITPQLPQPCSGPHRIICKQIAGPWVWKERERMWYRGGRGGPLGATSHLWFPTS